MVGRKKLLEYFIDDIPDSKFSGLPERGTVHSDENFRLDVQGVRNYVFHPLNAPILRQWFSDHEQSRMESSSPGELQPKEEFAC